MLYLSRYISSGRGLMYGVVDSDDDVETAVGRFELERIINSGIVIKGVETKGRCPNKRIVFITPYVYRDKVKATKSRALFGVEVVVNGGVLSAIYADGKPSDSAVKVVLSNFSHLCGSSILHHLPRSHKPIVLVLDDTLKFDGEPFDYWTTRGVVLDIRQVKRKATVKRIYDWAYAYTDKHDPDVICKSIIDDNNRLSGYLALEYLCRGFGNWTISRYIPNWPYACKFVQDYFKKSIEALASAPFYMTGRGMEEFRYYIKTFGDKNADDITWLCDSYHMLSHSSHRAVSALFDAMSHCTRCSGELLRRWFVIVDEFSPSSELCDLLVAFCKRGHEFLVSQARGNYAKYL